MLMRLVLIGLLSSVSPALQSGDIHVHGQGLLQLVQDERRVELTLQLPAQDVVGFEHTPHTTEQRLAVHQAALLLMNVDAVVSFAPAAGCRIQSSNVQSLMLDALGDVEQLVAVEVDADASDATAQHKHQHHSHDQHKKHDHDHAHADFVANYSFACQQSDQLTSVELVVFSALPSLQRVRVEAVTDQGAARAQGTRAAPRVTW